MAVDEDTKAALKEALKEWMDEKFATFGKWSLGGIAVAALSAITYILLTSSGWQRTTH